MDCNEAQKLIHLYIERKLDGDKLEDFLDHVEQCKECSDELEVNFTIYSAIKQLDDDNDFFDMKKLLRDDIRRAREHIQEKESHLFLMRFFIVIFVLASIIMVGLCLESYRYGGYAFTVFYDVVSPDAIILEAESETERITEHELETNHKKEMVIKVPETEEFTEPAMIPNEAEVSNGKNSTN